MFFLLTDDSIFRNFVGRGIGENFAGFLFQLLELVKQSIPFVIGKDFTFAVIITSEAWFS